MADTKTKKPKTFDVGDVAFVTYWRPFALPGNPGNGTWEVSQVQVVSCGKMICVEVASEGVLQGESPHRSLLRFVDPSRVFPDQETAQAVARSSQPPA